MSASRTVPASVPSLLQSSRPLVPSPAAKWSYSASFTVTPRARACATCAGARDFLIKPFEVRTLEEAVSAVLKPLPPNEPETDALAALKEAVRFEPGQERGAGGEDAGAQAHGAVLLRAAAASHAR